MQKLRCKYIVYVIKFYGVIMYVNGCKFDNFQKRKRYHLDNKFPIPEHIDISEVSVEPVAIYKRDIYWLRCIARLIISNNTLLAWNKLDSSLNDILSATFDQYRLYYERIKKELKIV